MEAAAGDAQPVSTGAALQRRTRRTAAWQSAKTDMPMLVMLEERDGYYAAGRMLRAADLVDALGQENNPEWKTVAFNTNGEMVAPNGSIGFRWGEKGKWNLEQRDGKTGEETELQLSLLGSQDEIEIGRAHV